MKKFFCFVKKFNLIYFFIILTILLICFQKYKYNIYSPYSDIGREFYINCQSLNNEPLYSGIFNVYAPLGYQINNLITRLFSDSLNTFYSIGLILSLLILTGIFLISEKFTGKAAALAISVLIIPTCIFYPSVSNWITPYSYSVLYALSGFIWSLYFLIKYTDEEKDKYLILSCLSSGFSLASKYEYGLILLVIFGVIIYKRPSKSVIIKSLEALILFPLLSIIILFITKSGLYGIIESINYMKGLAWSYSAKYFYYYNGFIPSQGAFKNAVVSLYKDFYYIIENIERYNHNNPLTNIQPNSQSFLWIGYSIILINIILIIKALVKRKNYTKDDILLLILCLAAIAGSIKCIFAVNFEIYGTFFFPILLIAFISFLNSFRLLKIFKRIIILILFSISFFYFTDNSQIIKSYNLKEISTPKGIIKVKSVYYESTMKLINYIQLNTKEGDKILVIPEGAIINYLLNRISDNKLYYLIPPNCEIFSDKYIINRLSMFPPDKIIISNIMYRDFNQTSFINSWGENIYKYIESNYRMEKIIGEDMRFYIYSKDINQEIEENQIHLK